MYYTYPEHGIVVPEYSAGNIILLIIELVTMRTLWYLPNTEELSYI